MFRNNWESGACGTEEIIATPQKSLNAVTAALGFWWKPTVIGIYVGHCIHQSKRHNQGIGSRFSLPEECCSRLGHPASKVRRCRPHWLVRQTATLARVALQPRHDANDRLTKVHSAERTPSCCRFSGLPPKHCRCVEARLPGQAVHATSSQCSYSFVPTPDAMNVRRRAQDDW